MSSLNYMELCRLCLVKERVSIPIFEGEGNVRQIFLKIASCLPVKVARDDKLPKKICSDCMYKLDNAYQFWNTTANAEKQLLQWLGEIASDDKKSVPSNTIETEQLVLKEEAVEQDQGSELAKGLSRVEAVLADDCKGGSEDEDESESEDEGSNSEDSGEDDGGEAPSKEEAESDEEPYGPLEPTTFVNVSLAGCDEAGPSGMQQQQQEQQQQEQQHHQQEQQQGPQQSQSLQQVQQSSQSQFLTPGAPSTSTAAPTSASGSSEDSSAGNIYPPSFTSPYAGTLVGPLGGRIFTVIPGSDYKFMCVLPPLMLKNQSPNNATYNIPSNHQSGIQEMNQQNLQSESCPCVNQNAQSRIEAVPPIVTEPGFMGNSDRMAVPVVENKALGPMKESGNAKKYACEKCGKEFKFNYKLKRHLSAHSVERPFECNVCNKKFKSKHDARAHERKHNRDKNEICDICGYATTFKSTLEIHKMRHFGQFRLKCDTCGKGFFSKLDLEGHMNAHMGEKPFQCDTCGKVFINKKHYTYHMKSSHPDPEENHSYPCKNCGKSFHSLPEFRQHKRIHFRKEKTVFVCDICGRAVTTHTSLVSHRRIHTGEKPFACKTCGKKFNSQSYLKVHDRTHSGERPHTCNLCGKCFTQQSSLVVHKRYHSGKKPYHCLVCSKDFVTRTLLKMHQKVF
ncbi:zinc finger protein 19 isoform X12 [Cryptotermes secundus]|uniref:zinc finger protein 19 isoform X12 n=1 Tax=Cryptotermes secundus TaxID=105785 RepID=UPI000CD7BC63|nr:zinc finger protein 19 isoform X12 [Cryptotermes secundus]